jgi:hypothetical protein
LSDHKKRRTALGVLLVAAAAAGVTACDDPFALEATRETVTDTLVAYSMSGTPPSYPAGFNAGTGAVTRITADIPFDIAFDLTSDGKIRVIPARLISATRQSFSGIAPTQQVGLIGTAGGFEAVTLAPTSGYKRDSLVVVGTNQAVIMEVASDACQFSLASLLYAKIVVDSVQSGSRQIFFRTTRNPNCGFRSFQPGVPKD